MDCYSDLGCFYKHPQYAYGTNEAATFLAGSRNYFTLYLFFGYMNLTLKQQ